MRAERLDEGLDIVTGLWSGEPFAYSGSHYEVAETIFRPTPVQRPRIPVWIAGALAGARGRSGAPRAGTACSRSTARSHRRRR